MRPFFPRALRMEADEKPLGWFTTLLSG